MLFNMIPAQRNILCHLKQRSHIWGHTGAYLLPHHALCLANVFWPQRGRLLVEMCSCSCQQTLPALALYCAISIDYDICQSCMTLHLCMAFRRAWPYLCAYNKNDTLGDLVHAGKYCSVACLQSRVLAWGRCDLLAFKRSRPYRAQPSGLALQNI